MTTREAFIKAALNPRLAVFPMLDSARPKDLQNIGRRLYGAVRGAKSPTSSFSALMGTGYKQMGDVKALRSAHLKQIGDLQRQIGRFAPGSPEADALTQALQQARSSLRRQQGEVFQQIGATAKPRMQMAEQGPKMLAGAGLAGGAGYMAGDYYGGEDREDVIRDSLAKVPLMDRLKYLLNPESFGNP